DEYRPRWMINVVAIDSGTARIVAGNGQIRPSGINPIMWTGVSEAKSPLTVQLPVSYFPGWQVSIDGALVSAAPAEGTGLIQIQVPEGRHRISAEFGRTTICKLADAFTAISFLIAVLCAGRALQRALRRAGAAESARVRVAAPVS